MLGVTRRPPTNRMNALISSELHVLHQRCCRLQDAPDSPHRLLKNETNFRRFSLNLDIAEISGRSSSTA